MPAMQDTVSIEELFAGRLFRVPDYQRGYSWEERQRTDFLEDLEVLREGREHYTGTIVLHEAEPGRVKEDAEGKRYTVVDVVDGQQRLTTIVLFMDALCRGLATLQDPATGTLRASVSRTYVVGSDMAGLALFKLQLNSDCDHFFRTSALGMKPGLEGPQITSEKRLADARAEFDAYLVRPADMTAEAYRERLTTLYRKVAHHLRVSVYQVGSEAEVGVIFEVMNNRGKQLTDLEKVKNYLLYVAATVGDDYVLAQSVNQAWAELLKQLMASDLVQSSDEDELLRAHWRTAYDPQPRKWDGSRGIKEQFDLRRFQGKEDVLLRELASYTESLRQSCVAFCDARSPERPTSFISIEDVKLRGQVRGASAKLTRTNVVAPFLPLLIATRLRFAADGAKYLHLVQLCEKYAFRVYLLGERRADAGHGQLFRVGYELGRGDIDFEGALERLRATLFAFCPDSVFTQRLGESEFDWYQWKALKYFLYEHEEALAEAKGASPKVSWDEVRRRERADSIEHILPQQPTDECWLDRFDPDERRRWTHDLGNLCLTKHNSVYGNKCFPIKRGSAGLGKPCYAESPFFGERELALLEDWTPETVAQRRTRLVEWATSRWHVDPPSTLDPFEFDDDGDVDGGAG